MIKLTDTEWKLVYCSCLIFRDSLSNISVSDRDLCNINLKYLKVLDRILNKIHLRYKFILFKEVINEQ